METDPDEEQAVVQVKLTRVQAKEQAEAAKIQDRPDDIQTRLGQAQGKSAEEQVREHAEL